MLALSEGLHLENEQNGEKLLNIVYVTPRPGRRKVALFKFGIWIEVYEGELLLVNRKYAEALVHSYDMEYGNMPKVYQSKEEAELGVGTLSKRYNT